MTPHRSCPYCQRIVGPFHGGMYPAHFVRRNPPTWCPVSWAPVGRRTTLRATWRAIIDLVTR